MVQVRAVTPDLADPALHAAWDRLAQHGSAFQTRGWVFCGAAERLRAPLLIEARADGAVVGLALFNRGAGRLGGFLALHETGDRDEDTVFIEHNGVLAAPAHREAVTEAVLREASRHAARLVLSGIDAVTLAAVRRLGGVVHPLQSRPAPYAVLDAETPWLQRISANTRAQVRRSDRSYGAAGPIVVRQAADADEALGMLAELLPLHAATWKGRGIESGFLSEAVQRFHRRLIAGGAPAELMRISAGGRRIGVLYNLRHAGRVASYQSGFDYADAAGPEKPGLSCHYAAIRDAVATGAREYDFLAGAARYKRSLSQGERTLYWVGWQRSGSAAGLLARLKGWAGR